MLDQIVLSLTLVLGVFLAEAIIVRAFGRQNSWRAGLVEVLLVVGAVSLASSFSKAVDSLIVRLFAAFFSGFFPALTVKSALHLYNKRYHPELFLAKKSMLVQLIRAMLLEGFSKKKISKIFRRVKISVDDYLNFF